MHVLCTITLRNLPYEPTKQETEVTSQQKSFSDTRHPPSAPFTASSAYNQRYRVNSTSR